MLFYILMPIILVILLGTFCLVKYLRFKGNEKFDKVMTRMLKVLVCIYAAIMLLNILLPDVMTTSRSAEELGGGMNQGMAVLRALSMVSFIALPLAVFYKNRTIRNIAIYFCIAVTIAQFACYGEYLAAFTDTAGKGLNSLPISVGFSNFLLNPVFRSIWFGLILLLQVFIPVVLAIQEKHIFDVKNGKEWLWFFVVLPCLIISIVPIYVPQFLFGYSSAIFDAYNWLHFLWLGVVIAEIVALYFIFRKKDNDTKMIVLFVLALSLIMQYNQMFGAITLNVKRLPFQLCNIGSYLVLISLLTKNKKLFNFTVIINVVGVLFALAMPDLDGKGLFYLYNMHFIFEHGNVLIVPVLALLFGIFPRLDKYALRDCVAGFAIYFAAVWVIGTAFNAVAVATGDRIYEANYLFMFLPKDGIKMLPFTEALFNINFTIGYATFYPVIQILIYLIFSIVCILLYFVIRLIYLSKDKSFASYRKRKQNKLNPPSEDKKELKEKSD